MWASSIPGLAAFVVIVAVYTPFLRPWLQPGRNGDYGVDAPYVVLKFASIGIAAVSVGVRAWPSKACGDLPSPISVLRGCVSVLSWLLGSWFLLLCAFLLYGSLVGKFTVADRVLDTVGPLTGRERILDIGCGSGLLAIAAAQRLHAANPASHDTVPPVACADVWSTADQSGNGPGRFFANVEAEGLSADDFEVVTADARALPADWTDSFDVIVSSLALHNIREGEFNTAAQDQRARAVMEILRVLRPGGRVVIWDICPGRPQSNPNNGCAVREVWQSLLFAPAKNQSAGGDSHAAHAEELASAMVDVRISEPLNVFRPSFIVSGSKRRN